MKRFGVIRCAITRLLAVILPAAAGVGILLFSATLKSDPVPTERGKAAVPVRVITLDPVSFVPQVTGYGTVEPAHEWRAVARVEGEIVETAPQLQNGSAAPMGTVLLRIDDTDIRLNLAQIDARRATLEVKDRTLAASQAIAERESALAEADLSRKRELQAQGATTQTVVEQAERTVLTAQAKLTDIANQLALNAAERNVLNAERDSAARSLGFTEVKAPFDVLIAEISADLGQVVSKGQTLFAADGTARAEVSAQFPMGRMGPIVRTLSGGNPQDLLSATVTLSQTGQIVTWPARISRISEAIDARTQSAEIIVSVDDPVGQAVPGRRPPLRRGMFVEVELTAPAVTGLVVPASAVWGGKALVVTGDGRLARRSVTVTFETDGLALVSEGLTPGEQLVVSDPAVAVPGMAVLAVEDAELAGQIRRQAAGDAAK